MSGIHRSCMVAFLCLALTALASCGKDGPTEPPAQVPSTINLSAQSVTLSTIGETIRLTATVLDREGRMIAGAVVTWSSSNARVAAVDPVGTVTAVSNGSAQIVASFSQARASATVFVTQEPASIAITPDAATIENVGASVQLEAEVFDAGDAVIPGATVMWSTGDPSVATVDNNGLVTAVSTGDARITATSGAASGSALVSVVSVREPESIAINIQSATLTSIGQHVQLEATVFDADVVEIPDAEVVWSSSEPLVATVGSTGLVTAFTTGTTRVIATSGSVSGFATIHVDLRGTGPSIDRQALIALYNATGGPEWTNQANWVTNAPLGNWYGVTTDADGRVSALNLRNNNLAGAIPSELRSLGNLASLNLGQNSLTGSLPSSLGQLRRLTSLWLDGNQFSGSIPSGITRLGNLETWDLSGNGISGAIPPELGRMDNLRIMDFQENDFTGSIPAELGQLASLERMRLDNNRLTGNIPAELGRLNNLEYLVLHHNQLTGSIPPELGQVGSLVVFEIQYNQLTGGVPKELGDLANMKTLELRNNRGMSGPLPSSLTNVSLLVLSLDSTQLCAPSDPAFQAWLAGIPTRSGVMTCSP